MRTLLNEGVDPLTNKTIIPKSVLEEVTTVHMVMAGRGSQPYFSVQGYGMGWIRDSYQGHEVRSFTNVLRRPLNLIRLFNTLVESLDSRPRSSCYPLTNSASSRSLTQTRSTNKSSPLSTASLKTISSYRGKSLKDFPPTARRHRRPTNRPVQSQNQL